MSLRGHHNSASLLVETASFLVVRMGGSYLALPADGVRGVLTQEEAGTEETVPTAGSRYQLVDLAQRLSLGVDLSGPEMRTVLYAINYAQGAIRVDQVVGLTDAERKDCLPLPPQFQCDERNWFGGMMLYQNQLVLIVNPSWALGELVGAVPPSVGEPAQSVAVISIAAGGSC